MIQPFQHRWPKNLIRFPVDDFGLENYNFHDVADFSVQV